jgi:phage tail sheath gpL-like
LVDDVSGVPAAGDIVPLASQTVATAHRVSVNNILSNQFVVSVGDTADDIIVAIVIAINGTLAMPVIASDGITQVVLEAKWDGESGNDIHVEITGTTNTSATFTIGQPAGGLVNPDVSDALTQMGNIWETLVLNCFNKSDTTTLDLFSSFGEGRWGSLVKKPVVVFTGDDEITVADATTIPEARKTDRVNSQFVAPGSVNLPLVIAARQLARLAVVAENNPPTGYNGQVADTLTPGTDGQQWDYLERDEAYKKGSSTTTIENGLLVLGDILTFYHPDGDELPAYNKVVTIVKLQTIIYNLDLIFEAPEWRAAPLIPDGQHTVNPLARTPSSAKAEIDVLIDYLANWAIISDPETAKEETSVQINNTNPDRLDIIMTVKVSGNTNIKAVTLNFGYFFGGN